MYWNHTSGRAEQQLISPERWRTERRQTERWRTERWRTERWRTERRHHRPISYFSFSFYGFFKLIYEFFFTKLPFYWGVFNWNFLKFIAADLSVVLYESSTLVLNRGFFSLKNSGKRLIVFLRDLPADLDVSARFFRMIWLSESDCPLLAMAGNFLLENGDFKPADSADQLFTWVRIKWNFILHSVTDLRYNNAKWTSFSSSFKVCHCQIRMEQSMIYWTDRL